MDIHMPTPRMPHLPALRRSRPRRSIKKAVIAVPGVLAAIGATTWAIMSRRHRRAE